MNLVSQYAPNQLVIDKGGDKKFLQSYKSIVAMYDVKNDIIYLGEDWDYSPTTLKYVKKFMADIMECDTSRFKKKDMDKIATDNASNYLYGTQLRYDGNKVSEEFYKL